MLVQIAPAAINAAVILFMPESPRWLFAHGFPEKAAKVLAKLHSRDNDVNSPLVRLEMGEFAENISLTGEYLFSEEEMNVLRCVVQVPTSDSTTLGRSSGPEPTPLGSVIPSLSLVSVLGLEMDSSLVSGPPLASIACKLTVRADFLPTLLKMAGITSPDRQRV